MHQRMNDKQLIFVVIIITNNTTLTRLYMTSNKNINFQNKFFTAKKMDPMRHHAAHTGQVHAVELLMDLGADPDARTKNRSTPMGINFFKLFFIN